MDTEIKRQQEYVSAPTSLKPDFSYDFARLLHEEAGRAKIERETEFRFGTDDDLERVLIVACKECSGEDWPEEQIQLLPKLRIFGREFAGYTVFLTGQLPNDKQNKRKFLTALSDWFDLVSEKLGYRWKYAGFVHWENDNVRPTINWFHEESKIYSERKDKSENAPAFLKRVYAEELAAVSITLSDLRQKDKSLWKALRNWRDKGNDLTPIIAAGQTTPGRPRHALAYDPAKLNPADPIHAEVIKLEATRAANRSSAAASYARLKLK